MSEALGGASSGERSPSEALGETILRIRDLRLSVRKRDSLFHAVEGLSLRIGAGEILGLVGESGCGKSLTALSIPSLLPEGVERSGGMTIFAGRDISCAGEEELRSIRGGEIGMVFQEPATSLNPLVRIGDQVAECFELHTGLTKEQRREASLDMIEKVGIPRPGLSAADVASRYPHQLSGGQRQRAMIAIALACKPRLIIADEPTTALDVTVQAQILELLRSINREYGCAILIISHDLAVVSELCDRVAVMYAGRIVEEGSVNNIFIHPVHEYTKGLMASLPSRGKKGERLPSIPGRVPPPGERGSGCAFAPRCRAAKDGCFLSQPPLVELGPSHSVSCLLADPESEMEYVNI
jgi:oligopeptide/dipeptide ABC transporter, ATP-binding protein, C-terminal domain